MRVDEQPTVSKFLVTYHGSEMPHDPEIMRQAREAFMQWAAKTGVALPEPGAPTGASKVVSRDGTGDGPAEGPFSGKMFPAYAPAVATSRGPSATVGAATPAPRAPPANGSPRR